MSELTISTPTTFGDWAYLAVNKHFEKVMKHVNKTALGYNKERIELG